MSSTFSTALRHAVWEMFVRLTVTADPCLFDNQLSKRKDDEPDTYICSFGMMAWDYIRYAPNLASTVRIVDGRTWPLPMILVVSSGRPSRCLSIVVGLELGADDCKDHINQLLHLIRVFNPTVYLTKSDQASLPPLDIDCTLATDDLDLFKGAETLIETLSSPRMESLLQIAPMAVLCALRVVILGAPCWRIDVAFDKIILGWQARQSDSSKAHNIVLYGSFGRRTCSCGRMPCNFFWELQIKEVAGRCAWDQLGDTSKIIGDLKHLLRIGKVQPARISTATPQPPSTTDNPTEDHPPSIPDQTLAAAAAEDSITAAGEAGTSSPTPSQTSQLPKPRTESPTPQLPKPSTRLSLGLGPMPKSAPPASVFELIRQEHPQCLPRNFVPTQSRFLQQANVMLHDDAHDDPSDPHPSSHFAFTFVALSQEAVSCAACERKTEFPRQGKVITSLRLPSLPAYDCVDELEPLRKVVQRECVTCKYPECARPLPHADCRVTMPTFILVNGRVPLWRAGQSTYRASYQCVADLWSIVPPEARPTEAGATETVEWTMLVLADGEPGTVSLGPSTLSQ